MNKSAIKEYYIKIWFAKRKVKAVEEYREVVENTQYANQCVSYRGNTFNPLNLKPREMKGIFEVQADSKYAERLDRLIRVMDDTQKVTGILTYILNYVESEAEFAYLVLGQEIKIRDKRVHDLDKFKEEEDDKLSFLRRTRLLADMVK